MSDAALFLIPYPNVSVSPFPSVPLSLPRRPFPSPRAPGFIGSYVVKMLVERGYHVRGTVRDLHDPRTNWLRGLADGTPGTIQLFAADLTAPGSFDEAVEGCELVCHVAAMVTATNSDPQAIVATALDGTRNVFGSIMKHQCAK
ncbi:unnamed protein product [Closterium sp. NIES-54]